MINWFNLSQKKVDIDFEFFIKILPEAPLKVRFPCTSEFDLYFAIHWLIYGSSIIEMHNIATDWI